MNEEKFKHVILYFLDKLTTLNISKLQTLMWLVNRIHVNKYGRFVVDVIHIATINGIRIKNFKDDNVLGVFNDIILLNIATKTNVI